MSFHAIFFLIIVFLYLSVFATHLSSHVCFVPAIIALPLENSPDSHFWWAINTTVPLSLLSLGWWQTWQVLSHVFPLFNRSSSSLLQAFTPPTPHLRHRFIPAISGPHLFNASLFWHLRRLASPRLRWSVRQWSARGRHLLRVSRPPPRGLPGLLRHDYRRRRLDGESVGDAHKHKLWESVCLITERQGWPESVVKRWVSQNWLLLNWNSVLGRKRNVYLGTVFPRIVPTNAWDHLRVTSEALLSLPNNANVPMRMPEKPERLKNLKKKQSPAVSRQLLCVRCYAVLLILST